MKKLSIIAFAAIAGCIGASVVATSYAPSSKVAIKAATPVAQKVSKIIVEYKDQDRAGIAGKALAKNTKLAAAMSDTARISAVQAMRLSDETVSKLNTHRIMGKHVVYSLGAKYSIEDAQKIAREMVKDVNVKSAMVDLPVRPFAYGDTGGQGAQLQWHLGTDVYAGMNFKEAWKLTEGSSSVVVSVIDTGFVPHPDLGYIPAAQDTQNQSKIVGQYDFITDPAVAGDSDGWDNSAIDEGDFCVDDTNPSDSSWHGTRVSGTITTKYNSATTLGGAPNVKLLEARALGRCGGSMSDVMSAILWSAGYPLKDSEGLTVVSPLGRAADVINLSLGSTPTSAAEAVCPSAMQSVIDAAKEAGSTVVVANGNENQNFISIPASCSGVIAVAATGRSGDISSYSSYGAGTTVGAPGGDFVKNVKNEPFYTFGIIGTTTTPTFTQFSEEYGTSFAAPAVAAAAALIKSLAPTATPDDVAFILKHTAKPYPAGSFCAKLTSDCGAGLVDIKAALDYLDIYYGSSMTVSGPSSSVVQAAGAPITFTANVKGPSADLTNLVYEWTQEDTGAPAVTITKSGNSMQFRAPSYDGVVTFSVKVSNPIFTYKDKVSITTSLNHAPVLNSQTLSAHIKSNVFTATVAVQDQDNNFEHLILSDTAPAGLKANGNVLNWGAPTVGTYTFTAQAVDYFGVKSEVATITINVQETEVTPPADNSSGGGSLDWLVALLGVIGALGFYRKQSKQ